METEYEPVVEYYDKCSTMEEMAEVDANTDDLEVLFSDLSKDEIGWEIINEKGEVLSNNKEYKTSFVQDKLVIDFLGEEGVHWKELRLSINVNGLTLDEVNKEVSVIVEANLKKEEENN